MFLLVADVFQALIKCNGGTKHPIVSGPPVVL
ncbi:hypothetical protein Zm00014a_001664 [Zea mays]|uniref:Uncharacterized protein n=1 Tax=Zea mays TaxID=4577 RepID=A0A317Y1T5_MAIZE|nr:hypothetical protein Zm00014a_001664 [Zea mays]